MTRRTALAALSSSAFALQLRGAHLSGLKIGGLKIGIMDGIIGLPSKPESVAAAAKVGFQGVQVTLGHKAETDKLLLSDPGLQLAFRETAAQNRMDLPSTYLDILHVNCLKNDPLAPHWISEGIKATKALGSPILMLVFFFKCGLNSRTEMAAVVEPLKRACAEAEEAGIVLGFENTISAKDNIWVLDQVKSPVLKVWYDIGNSTNIGHFDVPAEIRELGRDRICQFHIKDKTYLGEGAVNVRGALEAIADIGFHGYTVLETSAPTKDLLADAAKNLAIYRKMIAEVNA